MRQTLLTTACILTIGTFCVAETYTITIDETSITPATLEVAPGDIIVFDSPCATSISTGQLCTPDGIYSGGSYPPTCNGFQWTIPELASCELPIYSHWLADGCHEDRTAVVSVVNGKTMSVPSEYQTIGAAIAAAESGDRIKIAAGTYYEYDLSIKLKTITLEGEMNPDGSPGVIIDAQGQGRVFELIGGGPEPGEPGFVIVDNIVMTGGVSKGNGGAVSIQNCSPIFRNCEMTHNASAGNGGAVYVSTQSKGEPWVETNPLFVSCTLSENEAQNGGGMYADNAEIEMSHSLVVYNTASDEIGGIYHIGGGLSEINDSIICGNAPGQFYGAVDADDSCTFSQCLDEDGDGIVDGCEAGDKDGILHVPGEYPTLEMAFFEVSDGDTIMIEAGTFHQHGVDELWLEDISVSIIGAVNEDGSPATIIDGAGSNDINYITLIGEGEESFVVENLHVRNFSGVGGGMAVGFCEAIIKNCIFENNYGQTSGLFLSNVQGKIENCKMLNNNHYFIGGGLVCNDSSGATPMDIDVIDCVIEQNSGGIRLINDMNGSTVNLIGCLVRYNSPGIQAPGWWTLTLTDTTVCQNSNSEQIIGDWIDNGGNTVSTTCPPDCPSDINGDNVTNVTDLLLIIAAWGECGDCPEDIDDSGSVNVSDLLLAIAAWGDC